MVWQCLLSKLFLPCKVSFRYNCLMAIIKITEIIIQKIVNFSKKKVEYQNSICLFYGSQKKFCAHSTPSSNSTSSRMERKPLLSINKIEDWLMQSNYLYCFDRLSYSITRPGCFFCSFGAGIDHHHLHQWQQHSMNCNYCVMVWLLSTQPIIDNCHW